MEAAISRIPVVISTAPRRQGPRKLPGGEKWPRKTARIEKIIRYTPIFAIISRQFIISPSKEGVSSDRSESPGKPAPGERGSDVRKRPLSAFWQELLLEIFEALRTP